MNQPTQQINTDALIFTLIIGLIGIIVFDWIQRKIQQNKNVSEIKKNLPSMDDCIKHRQCLYQIKQLRPENIIDTKDDIGKELLKLNQYNKNIKMIVSTKDSKFTKMFEFLDDDTTQIEASHWTLIYLKELDLKETKKVGRIRDTIHVDYQYNLKNFEITKITNIEMVFRDDFNKSFNIDSIQVDENVIQIHVSNFK